jgi:hypothetical protein
VVGVGDKEGDEVVGRGVKSVESAGVCFGEATCEGSARCAREKLAVGREPCACELGNQSRCSQGSKNSFLSLLDSHLLSRVLVESEYVVYESFCQRP